MHRKYLRQYLRKYLRCIYFRFFRRKYLRQYLRYFLRCTNICANFCANIFDAYIFAFFAANICANICGILSFAPILPQIFSQIFAVRIFDRCKILLCICSILELVSPQQCHLSPTLQVVVHKKCKRTLIIFHAIFHDAFTFVACVEFSHCHTVPKEIGDKISQKTV